MAPDPSTGTELSSAVALPSPPRSPTTDRTPRPGRSGAGVAGVPRDDPDTPPEGRRWPRWILRPALIYLVSRAVTWTTLAVTTLFTHQSILQEVDRWDSRWFLRAAALGWPRHLPFHDGHVAGNTIAFFPLFPLSIRWLSDLT